MRGTWHRALAVGVVLGVTALTLLPVFDNGFVYDDIDVIELGSVIHDPGNLVKAFTGRAMVVSPEDPGPGDFETYRPMTLVSFFWDSAISGRDPFAYHLTNLLIHLLCVVLVYLLVRELLGEDNWAFALLGAAWFALTPHPNTAQIWINGRSDIFCTAYGLASILVWRRGLRGEASHRPAWYLLSGLVFLAGLLSKETLLMVLPAIWLWPDLQERLPHHTRFRRTLPFLGAATIYLGLRAVVLGGVKASHGASHFWASLRHLAPLELEGLLGALWPRRLYLRFLVDELGTLAPLTLALMALALLLMLIGLYALRTRAPVVAWGVLWFGVCLAPAALVSTMLWPGFGRYLYLPSVGLAAAIAAALQIAWARLPRWRPIGIGLAAVYLAALGVSLNGWARDFRDVETLYGAAIRQNPDGPHAYGWLGIAHRKRGQEEESIGPLALARQLAPEEPRYTQHLLYALVNTGRHQAASDLARECVELHPHAAEECHLLLYGEYQLSQPETAMEHLLACLRDDQRGRRCEEAFAHAVAAHQLGPLYRRLADERLKSPEMADVRSRTAQAMRSD